MAEQQKYLVPAVAAVCLIGAAVYFSKGGGGGGSDGDAKIGHYVFEHVGDMFLAMGCVVNNRSGTVKCPGKIEAPGPSGRPLGKKFSLADGAKAVVLHATKRIEEQAAVPESPPKKKRKSGGMVGHANWRSEREEISASGRPDTGMPDNGMPANGSDMPGSDFSAPSASEAGTISMSALREYGDYDDEEEMAKYSQAPK